MPGMEGDIQRAFGRNLRAYREARGLSQEAFADELGDGFVFATRAAVRYHELADKAPSPRE